MGVLEGGVRKGVWLLVRTKVLNSCVEDIGVVHLREIQLGSVSLSDVGSRGSDLISMWKAFPEGSPHVGQSLDNSLKSAAKGPGVKLR